MAKGASIQFKSYNETVPKILGLLRLPLELKKYDSIVLKLTLKPAPENNIDIAFVESVLDFIMKNKNPVATVSIAEGSEGAETEDLFESLGYQKLADKYGIGLVDLNYAETQEIEDSDFTKFEKIQYPKILLNSFVFSLTKLDTDPETEIAGAFSNMLGAYPAKHYRGFFSLTKNKLRKHPMKFVIHDIIRCKAPDFSIVDAAEKGLILAGLPLEMDKQCSKLLGINWKEVPYIKLLDDSFIETEEPSPSLQSQKHGKVY